MPLAEMLSQPRKGHGPLSPLRVTKKQRPRNTKSVNGLAVDWHKPMENKLALTVYTNTGSPSPSISTSKKVPYGDISVSPQLKGPSGDWLIAR